MKEYKHKNCTIRIHGTVDTSKVREATEIFLKQVMMQKKKVGDE